MKKLILALGIASAAVCANASLLYWQVGSSDSYDGGILYATNDGGATGTAIDVITPAPGKSYADVTGLEAYSFYIEYVNYGESSTPTSVVSSTVDNPVTYATLSQNGALVNSLSTANLTAMWTGTGYTSVPEPTSGLMLVLGMALLGLKRRRA